MKVKSLVAPTKKEKLAFNEIETVLENYLQPRKRLVIAEQTNFVAINQRNGESSGDFLARLKEAARYCEFGNLKTIADPEAYMIRLRFVAGLQNSEHKLKVLEHLQQNPDATRDDILLVIQQREQTVQFVKNRTNRMKQFPLPGTVNYERGQPEMAKFQPASTTKPKNARNAERGMNQGGVRPSAKRATTSRSRITLEKCVG